MLWKRLTHDIERAIHVLFGFSDRESSDRYSWSVKILDKLSGLRTSALYGAGGITSAWDTHPNLDANNPINMSEFRGGALNDGSGDP